MKMMPGSRSDQVGLVSFRFHATFTVPASVLTADNAWNSTEVSRGGGQRDLTSPNNRRGAAVWQALDPKLTASEMS